MSQKLKRSAGACAYGLASALWSVQSTKRPPSSDTRAPGAGVRGFRTKLGGERERQEWSAQNKEDGKPRDERQQGS